MSDDNPVRIKLFVEARPTEDIVEFDRKKWRAMTREERNDLLVEMVNQSVSDAGGAGYQLLCPGDEMDL